MTTYFATIQHSSISRAREIKIEGTLNDAKRAATKEFGDGFLDHRIVIYEDMGGRMAPYKVAERVIRRRHWRDFD